MLKYIHNISACFQHNGGGSDKQRPPGSLFTQSWLSITINIIILTEYLKQNFQLSINNYRLIESDSYFRPDRTTKSTLMLSRFESTEYKYLT